MITVSFHGSNILLKNMTYSPSFLKFYIFKFSSSGLWTIKASIIIWFSWRNTNGWEFNRVGATMNLGSQVYQRLSSCGAKLNFHKTFVNCKSSCHELSILVQFMACFHWGRVQTNQLLQYVFEGEPFSLKLGLLVCMCCKVELLDNCF